MEILCQCEIGFTLRFGHWFFFFFSHLKTQKLPSDNNISFIYATTIPRQMSVTDTKGNTPYENKNCNGILSENYKNLKKKKSENISM